MAAPAVSLSAVELDTSIQCRATIDTGIVNEYAERMVEGDRFPPIEVYGTPERCWIADGWHRVLAAKQIGALKIDAVVHGGGRVEALRHALGANANHGHRRSNADKRRAVEIALREFPALSSRQIAEICGVGDQLVRTLIPEDPQVRDSRTSVTGRDGKQYPARRQPEPPQPQEGPRQEEQRETKPEPKLGPPCEGVRFARAAIWSLEQITDDDAKREEGFALVRRWIDEHSADAHHKL